MDMFGDTDILGTWLQLFLSPFGLMILAISLATILIENIGRSRPRRRGERLRGRARLQEGLWRPGDSRSSVDREAEPLILPEANPALDEILRLSPGGFEQFVADLFRRRGYAVKVVGGDGDHGVDLVVTNPKGERELVQCKRWDRRWIGESVVRDFYGALMHDAGAVRGYIVTTSFFSSAARLWAEGKPISLIDGRELAGAAERIIEMGR